MSSKDTGNGPRAKLSLLGRIERLALDIGAVAIILIALYVTLGIVLRTFFRTSVPDETVIIGEAMIVAMVLPLAYVAAEGSFIAVDVFTSFLRQGGRGDACLRVLAALVGLISAVVILIAAWGSLRDAILFDNYFFGILSLPEWPGRLAFFVGYVLFAVRLCLLLWQAGRDTIRPS